MLRSLHIVNYALIDETKIDLGNGLNMLTGETGAGKSLLLGAIGLILGKRLDYGFIFNPDKKCVVEAVFQDLPPGLVTELKKIEDFDWDDKGLVIRREASADGKSRAFVNDTPVNLQVLKDVTGLLVDLHGQHQNQMLLAPEFQIKLLDQYAGTTAEAKAFGKMLAEIGKIRKEIEGLAREEANARQQQDYFNFLLEELISAKLSVEEEATLDAELETLEHAGEIKESLEFAANSLYDEESSAYSQLTSVIERLDRAAKINGQIQSQHQSLQEARILIQEAVRELSHVADEIDVDPATLATMQERSDFLNRLKKKFNVGDVAALIALREEYQAKVGHFDSLGDQIAKLQKQVDKADKELLIAGKSLEASRIKVAKTLNASVDALLKQVGLDNAQFEAQIIRNEDAQGSLELDGKRIQPNPSGINTVDFRIRTNAGMPMGSLGQTASGGEISRVMLAIKAALAEKAELSVLIFDEIDTGISGEVANKVGKVMAQLAKSYQLIAITHLPQIAARGDHHFRIYKEVTAGSTISRVTPLDENGRIMELAHMLSGADPSESAILNAKELITSARR